eukprot:CAMPEP_0170227430 /NCGR_PEP_ID=MMETSP0116_2-20130129/13429_1 /TAXON_ID=400756 /ORGANISM="Durinskia baltica, Strain CSIRO CS-38" /LENGTH=190 /DNA_ID=CAMNT_0010478161 /DNA_START=87 /DNA_END=657 /DNA_ORIENTATION=+
MEVCGHGTVLVGVRLDDDAIPRATLLAQSALSPTRGKAIGATPRKAEHLVMQVLKAGEPPPGKFCCAFLAGTSGIGKWRRASLHASVRRLSVTSALRSSICASIAAAHGTEARRAATFCIRLTMSPHRAATSNVRASAAANACACSHRTAGCRRRQGAAGMAAADCTRTKPASEASSESDAVSSQPGSLV